MSERSSGLKSITVFLCGVGLACLSGCGRETDAPVAVREVVRTNLVERVVTVTNVVTTISVVTNVVQVPEVKEKPPLSARKTAPYHVSARHLGPVQMRSLLVAAGARVLECESASVAVVEAPDAVVSALKVGDVMRVDRLRREDKLPAVMPDGATVMGVRIIPLSSFDLPRVVAAVREAGGELVQVISGGGSVVRAKMSAASICQFAERNDVRRIERDEK